MPAKSPQREISALPFPKPPTAATPRQPGGLTIESADVVDDYGLRVDLDRRGTGDGGEVPTLFAAMRSFHQSVNRLRYSMSSPGRWPARWFFLLDGLGASVSLGMVLVLLTFQPWFGMPVEVVKLLLPLTALCMVYSLLCWLLNPERWRLFLLLIALVNLGYAVLILILLVVQRDALTPLGFAYFGGEVVILVGLGCLEIQKSWCHR